MSGENYPDALAAGPIAGDRYANCENGPILLTRRDSPHSATIAGLRAIHPDHTVIVGGTAAISSTVAQQPASVDW